VHDILSAVTASAVQACLAEAGLRGYSPRVNYTFSLRPPGFDPCTDPRGSVTIGHRCHLLGPEVVAGPAAELLRRAKRANDLSKQSADGFLFEAIGSAMLPHLKSQRLHGAMMHLLLTR
jgi:hypothetical protein